MSTQPSAAARYLHTVLASRSWDWSSRYVLHGTGDLTATEGLALAHPMHYEATVQLVADAPGRCRVRGQRRFPEEPGRTGLRCRSDIIWGYECPNEGAHVVADHVFPWAFGGPTVASNLIYLCELHNSVKGADFHTYPSFADAPSWLDAVLERAAAARHRQAL